MTNCYRYLIGCIIVDNHRIEESNRSNVGAQRMRDLIQDSFRGLNVDLAIIGSQSQKDLDIFVVNNQSLSLSNISDTLSFLDRLSSFVKTVNCEIIVKHEHRSWVNTSGPLVHLLFYPSYDHLEVWELPSFISCAYSDGDFLIGDNTSLRKQYVKYRKRLVNSDFDLETYHLLIFMDLAITSLVYLTVNSNIFTKSVYMENLQYVFRYTLRELFISKLGTEGKITFWEKDELIEYIYSEFPEFSPIAKLLQYDVNSPLMKHVSKKQIKSLFIEYLKLCDLRLAVGNNLRINDLIEI